MAKTKNVDIAELVGDEFVAWLNSRTNELTAADQDVAENDNRLDVADQRLKALEDQSVELRKRYQDARNALIALDTAAEKRRAASEIVRVALVEIVEHRKNWVKAKAEYGTARSLLNKARAKRAELTQRLTQKLPEVATLMPAPEDDPPDVPFDNATA